MKKYPPPQIPSEAWSALYAFFRTKRLDWLSEYEAIDGINPLYAETVKAGILVVCETWYLPDGETLDSRVLLCRPKFSRIEDFIPAKLESSEIRHSELGPEGQLYVEIA